MTDPSQNNQNDNHDSLEEDPQESPTLMMEIDRLVKSIPRTVTGEEYRIACAVATGGTRGKSLTECCRYYSLDLETASKWWDIFSIKGQTSESGRKRGHKTSQLESFVKSNIGKTLKSTDIIKACDITAPTLYNFINSNRGYFKKAGRGVYEIIDMESQRVKEKSRSN